MHRLLALLLSLLCLVVVSCDNKSSRVWDEDRELNFSEDEQKEVREDIAGLARGADLQDIEGSAIYSDKVNRLIARGSKIEPHLIESLAGHPDWAVRMGVIDVLKAIGTRKCIESLVKATGDPAPLVSLNANKLLEGMTDHRVIPAAGQPALPEGLPPVPQGAPEAPLTEDERLWSSWHQHHVRQLHQLWSEWWKANRGTAKIN